MLPVKNFASKKAATLAGRSIHSCANSTFQCLNKAGNRQYATSGTPASVKETAARPRKNHNATKTLHKDDRKKKVVANRDFLRSILESNATMREARSYLKAFAPPSVSQSPNFSQTKANDRSLELIDDPSIRIALVKIVAPQDLDDETLQGIGQTLFQLERLGLLSIVVLDCNLPEGHPSPADGKSWRQMYMEQTGRMVSAIDKHMKDGGRGARTVDSIVGITEGESSPTGSKGSKPYIMLRKLLMAPLRKGIIPVVPSWGHSDLDQAPIPVSADDVVVALTRELAGLHARIDPDEDPEVRAQEIRSIREEASIDRLIILDPKGGIPTSTRSNRYHVFINLEQEFEDIKQELLGSTMAATMKGAEGNYVGSSYTNYPRENIQRRMQRLASGNNANPYQYIMERTFDLNFETVSNIDVMPSPSGGFAFSTNASHIKNLELLRRVLSILKPNASALLTTPEEAANKHKPDPFRVAGVGTRPLRNPLIHNLLTDKPAFSSSLPASRIGLTSNPNNPFISNPALIRTPTTFAKRGMPVTIFPDPRISPWEPPSPTNPSLTLQDSRIDLPRLVHLINDSFNRKLDVPRYLERIHNRIAGVIIAGEYEGGALLTWELPPGVPDDGSPESRARMVPYLDKFAVLKKSQGTGGVADIVFTALIRSCFPQGVVWRSRKNNPVNKWYFERARGTRQLVGSDWTMFWTTENEVVFGEDGKMEDYEAVCRAIVPTWRD